jgi:hypothetical protein
MLKNVTWRCEMDSCTSGQNAGIGSCEYVNEPSDSRSRTILYQADYSTLFKDLAPWNSLLSHFFLLTAIPSPYRRWSTKHRPIWLSLELQVPGAAVCSSHADSLHLLGNLSNQRKDECLETVHEVVTFSGCRQLVEQPQLLHKGNERVHCAQPHEPHQHSSRGILGVRLLLLLLFHFAATEGHSILRLRSPSFHNYQKINRSNLYFSFMLIWRGSNRTEDISKREPLSFVFSPVITVIKSRIRWAGMYDTREQWEMRTKFKLRNINANDQCVRVWTRLSYFRAQSSGVLLWTQYRILRFHYRRGISWFGRSCLFRYWGQILTCQPASSPTRGINNSPF